MRAEISSQGWPEPWRKEDWWVIWIGPSIALAASVLFWSGTSLRWLAVAPPQWTDFSQVTGGFMHNGARYLVLYLFWLAAFSLALAAVGQSLQALVPAFSLLYVASYMIFFIGQWEGSVDRNLERPLVALFLGLFVANVFALPLWLDAGFRGELYVKAGIVLLGATLPISLIARVGPVALLQASIVSLATSAVICFVAVRLSLDRRCAAILGVGGAVCDVSGAMAAAGAVGAKKDDTAVTITIVVLWAMVMIFALPLVVRAVQSPAGIAAAHAYAGYVGRVQGLTGTADQTLRAFTLVTVAGRHPWVGIWAVGLAIVATTRWAARPAGSSPDVGEIWRRIPKFVTGFFSASMIKSAATARYTLEEYDNLVMPYLVGPVRDMRSWAFILCFFSIGDDPAILEQALPRLAVLSSGSASVRAQDAFACVTTSSSTAAAAAWPFRECDRTMGTTIAGKERA